jgi:hypothetical protein
MLHPKLRVSLPLRLAAIPSELLRPLRQQQDLL